MSEANKQARINYLQSLAVRYRTALESIAANTCCDHCQEAAMVAKSAITLQKSQPAGNIEDGA